MRKTFFSMRAILKGTHNWNEEKFVLLQVLLSHFSNWVSALTAESVISALVREEGIECLCTRADQDPIQHFPEHEVGGTS